MKELVFSFLFHYCRRMAIVDSVENLEIAFCQSMFESVHVNYYILLNFEFQKNILAQQFVRRKLVATMLNIFLCTMKILISDLVISY